MKLAKSLDSKPGEETTIKRLDDSLWFTGHFDHNENFDLHISTILINNDIVIAAVPGEPFVQLQLDWKKKVDMSHPFG